MASALNTSAKYLLSVYELRQASQRGGENAPPWENKSMWIFYIELTTGENILRIWVRRFIVLRRFPEAHDLPRFLRSDYHFLRLASEHRTRCLCNR